MAFRDGYEERPRRRGGFPDDYLPPGRPTPESAPAPGGPDVALPDEGGGGVLGGAPEVPPTTDPGAEPTPYPDFGSFEIPTYPGPFAPSFDFRPVPQFRPRAAFSPSRFRTPSLDEAMQSPGYQFRLKSGTDALERSAAARGTLRTGGTLKDLIEYGQDFAAQEYGAEFDRAMRAYEAQYGAERDAYAAQYQMEKDAFAPQLAEWQTLAGAERDAALAEHQRRYDAYARQMEAQMELERWRQMLALMPGPSGEVAG